MKSYLKQTNIPFVLLFGQLIKSFILPVSIYDGLALVAFSVLFGFKLYLDHIRKPDFSQTVNDRVDAFINITEIRLKQMEAVHIDTLNKMDAKVSAVTLATQRKTASTGGTNFGW